METKEVEILISFGMGCIGCPASQSESIGEVAAVHVINVDNLFKSLNSI